MSALAFAASITRNTEPLLSAVESKTLNPHSAQLGRKEVVERGAGSRLSIPFPFPKYPPRLLMLPKDMGRNCYEGLFIRRILRSLGRLAILFPGSAISTIHQQQRPRGTLAPCKYKYHGFDIPPEGWRQSPISLCISLPAQHSSGDQTHLGFGDLLN